MERLFENNGRSIKIDSKLLDKVLAVYEEIRTDESKISVTTDLKWNDDYRINTKLFIGAQEDEKIIGNNALVLNIENCPNIHSEMQSRVLKPFIDAVSNPRLLQSVLKDWREDVTMTVDEGKEITTYILDGFMIKETATNSTSDNDVTICFDAVRTFASRKFKD